MKIAVLNFCPLCQQPVTEAAVLPIAAPLPRWRVHCHSGAWAHITGTDGISRIIYMERASWPKAESDIDRAWAGNQYNRSKPVPGGSKIGVDAQ